jgi:2-amino-4-hydroxy-6-hydroxymethyldihydropteridine diphosphokinase
MTTVFLSLGSNAGRREYYLEEMCGRLSSVMEQAVIPSQLMETEPLGMPGCQRWFLNCIVRAVFSGTPDELLAECNRIESDLGRTREKPFSARTADIDILLFGHAVIREESLIVPHPRMLRRRFCLEGLRQVGPAWKIPGTGLTVSEQCGRMPPHVRNQRIIFMNGKNHSPGQEQTR